MILKNLYKENQLSETVYDDVKILVKTRERIKKLNFTVEQQQNDKTIIAVADIEKNRASDGHICKSEGEVIIDDILRAHTVSILEGRCLFTFWDISKSISKS